MATKAVLLCVYLTLFGYAVGVTTAQGLSTLGATSPATAVTPPALPTLPSDPLQIDVQATIFRTNLVQ